MVGGFEVGGELVDLGLKVGSLCDGGFEPGREFVYLCLEYIGGFKLGREFVAELSIICLGLGGVFVGGFELGLEFMDLDVTSSITLRLHLGSLVLCCAEISLKVGSLFIGGGKLGPEFVDLSLKVDSLSGLGLGLQLLLFGSFKFVSLSLKFGL